MRERMFTNGHTPCSDCCTCALFCQRYKYRIIGSRVHNVECERINVSFPAGSSARTRGRKRTLAPPPPLPQAPALARSATRQIRKATRRLKGASGAIRDLSVWDCTCTNSADPAAVSRASNFKVIVFPFHYPFLLQVVLVAFVAAG